MAYMQNYEKKEECVFCEALADPDGTENLIVYRGNCTFVILNRFPYTSGHLMILPFKHCSSIDALDEITRAEIMEVTNTAIAVLKTVYKPQGFNVGMNIGDAAGAGIAAHLHMHVVPRWSGDTNFMSSLAKTRVLPEALGETYRRVREGWMRSKE
jgi:ATP adenylyltransferase